MIKQNSFIMIVLICLCAVPAQALTLEEGIFQVGDIKPVDSDLVLAVGDQAPDFTLPGLDHKKMSLSSFKNRKNVVISFVPAAWTPVCSDQWPGYNIVQDIFDKYDAVLLGITVDNIPTLYAWTKAMGDVWFPVLSDFYPHGAVAARYGVLRTDGVTERALFVIDKEGVIRYIDVHDINVRPPLEVLVSELEKLNSNVKEQ